MTYLSRWSTFSQDPFSFVDNINLTYGNLNLNLFQKYKRIQYTAVGASVVFLVMWIVAGFDSTPLQLIHVLYDGVPGFIFGQKSWADLIGIYNLYYGKEMHYSAFIIYFLLYYGLSRNFERVGITKCRNMVYSFAGMFLAISVFEFFWIYGFGVFQNQPWVYTWKMPQMKILLQDLGFALVGGLTMLYIWMDSYKLEGKLIVGRNFLFRIKDWRLWLLVSLSVAAALFWIFYPGPAQQISVPMKDGSGVWTSSRLFPQTLYTVDTLPSGAVNAGDWFYVQNDGVHAVNTIVKFLWAGVAYMALRVKKVET